MDLAAYKEELYQLWANKSDDMTDEEYRNWMADLHGQLEYEDEDEEDDDDG